MSRKLIFSIFCFTLLSPNNFLYCQYEYSSWITKEIESSIKLHIEALDIMDSLSEEVWPDWEANDQVTYFFGGLNNNAVFINPTFVIPKGFIPYHGDNSKKKIFIREKSNMTEAVGGLVIYLDSVYYDASSIMPFSIDTILYNYYLTELAKITDSKETERDISKFIRLPEFYMSLIFHETFHFYQEKKKVQYPMFWYEIKYFERPKINACSYIEGMLLQRALNTDKKEDLIEIVRQFIAVRQRKSKELSLWQRRSEKIGEFDEGTALYIQMKFLEILSDLKYKPQTLKDKGLDYFSLNLKNEIHQFDSLYFAVSIRDTEYTGDKSYFYGHAQAKILDKLGIELWKDELMEKDIYLIDLLIKYSNYNKKQYKIYLNRAFKYYNYEELLKYTKNMKSEGIETFDYNII